MRSYNKFIILKQNLLNNIRQIKNKTNGKKICFMVKANAYGAGLEDVCHITKNFVDFFGVSSFSESMRIRNTGIKKPILVVGKLKTSNIEDLIKNNISFTINELEELSNIEMVAKRIEKQAKVHIKLNTGMNRYGVKNINIFKEIVNKIYKSKNIVLEGVFTHFSTADCKDKTNFRKQRDCFLKFLRAINLKENIIIIHYDNSGVVLSENVFKYDMVRVGIALYGGVKNNIGLKPILQIKSYVVKINNVKKGEYVGYGYKFKAKRKMRIAVIPIGYGDGYLRAYAKKGKVIINQKYYRIVGNICMDCLFVDISNTKNVKLFEEVFLIGKQNKKEITALDIAKNTKTISYEILTNFKTDRFDVVIK